MRGMVGRSACLNNRNTAHSNTTSEKSPTKVAAFIVPTKCSGPIHDLTVGLIIEDQGMIGKMLAQMHGGELNPPLEPTRHS
jgi:hypothetical protein